MLHCINAPQPSSAGSVVEMVRSQDPRMLQASRASGPQTPNLRGSLPPRNPRPDRTLPLSGLFFGSSPPMEASDSSQVRPVGTNRWLVRMPGPVASVGATPASSAGRGVSTGGPRCPWRRTQGGGGGRKPTPEDIRRKGHRGPARDPVPASARAHLVHPTREGFLLSQQRYSLASGRTICTRLNNVLPGSSHGIMCAECSNHTPCLNGACTRCSQRSVGAEGVV